MNYTPFLVPRFYLGMTTKRLRLQYKKKEAEPLIMHSQVEPGNEKNENNQRISVRFNALKLLARNLFPGGKTRQNRRRECEEFHPFVIDQQNHKFPGGMLGLLRMEGIQ